MFSLLVSCPSSAYCFFYTSAYRFVVVYSPRPSYPIFTFTFMSHVFVLTLTYPLPFFAYRDVYHLRMFILISISPAHAPASAYFHWL
ncbi:hypothetical protein FPV67DRAFT_1154458 [Lyophyllum atratum]|nr:hypothetical protein FPV67DRAFT_1154458 [Lyophyllum atratum]